VLPTGKDSDRVTPTRNVPAVSAEAVVCCAVAAYGTVEADAGALAVLRQNPGPPGSPLAVPASLLKHADEQTLVSLAAVLRALPRLNGAPLTDWGVLAAPRFVGRQMFILALQKFCEEGAWGVSPHLIPHRSLHSISGTISQALKIHGPNYGVGNGPAGASEGVLAAAALVAGGDLPGVWLVLSGWSPETTGQPPWGTPAPGGPPICRGIALALVPSGAQMGGPRLYVSTDRLDLSGDGQARRRGAGPWLSPESLSAALAERPAGHRLAFRLRCGGWMALEHLGAEGETRR
jgi:hypothetical protein